MTPSIPSLGLCLLLVMATIGAATSAGADHSKKKKTTILPGSCLMAASTLCANADTNAMRCLRKLAIAGDARVPSDCAEAIMAGASMKGAKRGRNHASRSMQLSRMLAEGGGACSTQGGNNSCPGSFKSIPNNRCNDANNGCSGCGEGTFTMSGTVTYISVVQAGTNNPNSIACNNICCKVDNGDAACCQSFAGTGGTSVFCDRSGNGYCTV